jgi:hypothetical protein
VTEVVADLLATSIEPAKNGSDDNQPVAKTLPLIKVRPVQPPVDRKLTIGMVRLGQGSRLAA